MICAGVDTVTISSFAQNLDAELVMLSTELGKETDKPLPQLRFFITKAHGGQRPLSVPVVRDRIVQNGVVAVIGPRFEKEFESCSFAYRKGHSVKQALQQIEYLHQSGYTWVLDADITSYIENVDRGLLLARVSELVPSKRVINLGAKRRVRPGAPLLGAQESRLLVAREIPCALTLRIRRLPCLVLSAVLCRVSQAGGTPALPVCRGSGLFFHFAFDHRVLKS